MFSAFFILGIKQDPISLFLFDSTAGQRVWLNQIMLTEKREGTAMRAIRNLMMMVMTIAAGTMLLASLASAATLTIKAKEGIGSYLADEKGMALYLFKKDSLGKSACGAANGCLEKWPVFYSEKIEPAPGIDAASIGVITRDDGLKQTTYKGNPLYYFFNDKDDEDVYGQGVNGVWFVVAP
jgi:predicted lipoprotein with Yx(FWY)xxD motif